MSIFEKQIAENVAAWTAKRAAMGRPVKEWIGKTAKAMPTERVRHRILETFDSTCYLSGIRIDPAKGFDVEHVVTVRDGGIAANREGNMRPALRDPHILKTAREKKERSRAERKARANSGTKAAPKQEIKTAPAPVRPDQKKASKPPEKGGRLESIMALPRRNLFR